jgi:DNA-directed RNA polymerase specialized sigma24 family protein
MRLNKYDGCVEQWKADLIARRAAAYGFQENDILDIQQDIVLKVMNFRYDPIKSNGAQESTVLQVLIDNELKMRLRSEKRRNNTLQTMRWITELVPAPSKCQLAVDIHNALTCLSRIQRQICLALSEGRSIREIALKLHVDPSTIRRHMRRIGSHFQAIDLDQWISG